LNNRIINNVKRSIKTTFDDQKNDNDKEKKRHSKKDESSDNKKEIVNLFIQMEYCFGMTLEDYMKNPDFRINEIEGFFIFNQIVEGITYIHQGGFIHRDLKPSNILLAEGSDEAPLIKISDFGLSRSLNGNTSTDFSCQDSPLKNTSNVDSPFLNLSYMNIELKNSYKQFLSEEENLKKKDCDKLSTKIGTPLYASPEQENSLSYNSKTDIFSIGVILYEMWGQFTTYHSKFKHLNGLRETEKVQPDFRAKFP